MALTHFILPEGHNFLNHGANSPLTYTRKDCVHVCACVHDVQQRGAFIHQL